MAGLKFFGGTKQATSAERRWQFAPVAVESASGPSSADVAGRLKAAAKMPGFRDVCGLCGEALGLHATGVLLEPAGQSMDVQHRIAGAWQPADPVGRDQAVEMLKALKTLVAPAAGAKDVGEGECLIRAGKSRRPCRVTVRVTPKGEQVLLTFGDEVTAAPASGAEGGLMAAVSRFIPGAKKAVAAVEAAPAVTLDVTRGGDAEQAKARLEKATASPGYAPACGLIAAAVQARASEVVIECTAQQAAAHGDVDGVRRPLMTYERSAGDALVAALKTVAGLDPRERRKPRAGQCQTVIEGKPWPCRVLAQGTPTGEVVQVSLDYGRPKIKTLADAGVPEKLADRIRELMALESGVIVVATPKRGGLSTLFDAVVASADRMVREFILLEDARNPRGDIQNVKPIRWDAAKGISPAAAVDLALREYPAALVTCDLKDADLAQKLVEQAGQGKLVVIGIRAADAAEGIANLRKLGVERQLLGRVLLAAIGGRLIRKLCPKCQEEFLPSGDVLATFKLDASAAATFRRAAHGGCAVCTGTGYLGRTGIFEIAAGRTLNAYVAKGADAKVLRQAAAKDGSRSLRRDGVAKVVQGVTTLEEIQRVFAKG